MAACILEFDVASFFLNAGQQTLSYYVWTCTVLSDWNTVLRTQNCRCLLHHPLELAMLTGFAVALSESQNLYWCILIKFGTLLFTQHTAVAGHAPAVARSEYRVSLNSTMVSNWNQIYLVCTVTLISAPFVGAGTPSRYIIAVTVRVFNTHCECIWPPEIAWQ